MQKWRQSSIAHVSIRSINIVHGSGSLLTLLHILSTTLAIGSAQQTPLDMSVIQLDLTACSEKNEWFTRTLLSVGSVRAESTWMLASSLIEHSYDVLSIISVILLVFQRSCRLANKARNRLIKSQLQGYEYLTSLFKKHQAGTTHASSPTRPA